MQMRSLSTVLLALLALLVSPFALAHSGTGYTAGLADGFMHPVTGLDHLLIAIAAGFWAGRSGDHGVPDVLFFMVMLLGGVLLGFCCQMFPQLQLSTILALVLTAAFIAASIAAPQFFAYIFFGGFAVYHGIVHMLGMPAHASAAGFILGLFFSTGLLLMLGLILRQVVVTRKPHSETTR
jgi:urease accessory protein